MPQALLPIFPPDATAINEIMSFCQRDGSVYYLHGCVPVYTHPARDGKAFRLWASQLVVDGSCTQAEVVRAFGISPISMKRRPCRQLGPADPATACYHLRLPLPRTWVVCTITTNVAPPDGQAGMIVFATRQGNGADPVPP
jgi:hypothetical protein